MASINEDWDWLHSIDAVFVHAGVDIVENLVTMEISSANPDAAARILEHYGVPPSMLLVRSDGTGYRLLPWGTVSGLVTTADGTPPGANALNLRWESDGPGECGILDMGFGVGDDGRFELPCAPGEWTITVETMVLEVGWEEVGRGTVVVPPGGAVELQITLEPGAPLEP